MRPEVRDGDRESAKTLNVSQANLLREALKENSALITELKGVLGDDRVVELTRELRSDTAPKISRNDTARIFYGALIDAKLKTLRSSFIGDQKIRAQHIAALEELGKEGFSKN